MTTRLLALVLAWLIATAARGDELKSFPPAAYKGGELKYVEKVPVLVLRGKPAEMGEQFGVLAIRNAPDLTGLHQQFLKDSGQEARYPIIVTMSKALKPGFPA